MRSFVCLLCYEMIFSFFRWVDFPPASQPFVLIMRTFHFFFFYGGEFAVQRFVCSNIHPVQILLFLWRQICVISIGKI